MEPSSSLAAGFPIPCQGSQPRQIVSSSSIFASSSSHVQLANPSFEQDVLAAQSQHQNTLPPTVVPSAVADDVGIVEMENEVLELSFWRERGRK